MRFMAFALLTFCLLSVQYVVAQSPKSPREMFGFRMGEDRKLIHWEQITAYLKMLDADSDRIVVEEIGRTTLDRPMIMAIISSENTIKELDTYKDIQQKIGRPYDIRSDDAEKLITKGKTVVIITMNIHSTEIAASQESVELAYELATATDEKTTRILENTILLMVPSLNPDGQDMISKWYMKDVGTEYEGTRMPYKYHHYVDHDNNRDWHFFNLEESRNVARILYHEWYPEIVMDQHQMGSHGARLFLPPYSDPVNPNVPPSLMANLNLAGKYMISDLHDQGFSGLVTNTIFNAFFEGTMSKTPLWHNRIGILTEAASVRLATPIFFPKTSLRGMGQDLPDYKQQTNFLDPWPGGWWRLRDIVEYQKAAAISILDFAAIHRQRLKTNFYNLNRKAIEAGGTEAPFAYVLPVDQHDPNNAVELLSRLRISNVDVYKAEADFSAGGKSFRAGDFIVPLAQPGRAYIKDVMERQQYPNLREYPGGPPRQPYDVTAWTFPLQMGVSAEEIEMPFSVPMKPVEPVLAVNTSGIKAGWLAIERRYSNSYKLVNDLLNSKVDVFQLTEPRGGLPVGTFAFWCDAKAPETYIAKSEIFQVPLVHLEEGGEAVKLPGVKIKAARVGIYQPWIPWMYDEGWLRLVMDNFGFSYEILHNSNIGNKLSDIDVLVFGSQSANSIVNGMSQSDAIGAAKIHKEYQGGINAANVDKILQFLMDGGTAMFFGDACNFAIDKLHLPAANVLSGLDRSEYFIPGSILEMHLDTASPLTFGMKRTTPVYMNRNVALNLRSYTAEIGETGYFGNRDLLLSGWAVGAEKLHDTVALAEIPVGKGKAILYAFRPQHRGQMFGTFKLIFNALYK